jgi:hypothetical protein
MSNLVMTDDEIKEMHLLHRNKERTNSAFHSLIKSLIIYQKKREKNDQVPSLVMKSTDDCTDNST